MHEQEHMIEGAGTYIWLHYATTVMVNGRPRTIEMGIPVPIGADDALREQLLREANAGMNQLIGSVENRVAQLLHQVPATQGAIPTPTPAAKPSVTPPPRPRPTTPSNAPVPAPSSVPDVSAPSRPPTQPQQTTPLYNASQTPQRHEVRENREIRESREIREPREPERENERERERERVSEVAPSSDATSEQNEQPVRQTMNLPSMREISANVSLPQFIQYINEHLGLTPRQAMEILKVKSLSGINLRDALEQLQLAQSGQHDADGEGANEKVKSGVTGITDASAKPGVSGSGQNGQRAERAERVERIGGDERPSKPETRNNSGQQATSPKQPIPFRPAGSKVEESRVNPKVVRESPAYFDEEEDENDSNIEDELDELLDDGDDEEQQGLTPEERIQAVGLVSRLRESQGVAAVNPARLKVLSNVTDGQIDEEQLDDLIRGVWGITSTKRLKVDQAEALISWAKEDDFQSEAEIVLLYLQEDALARGNR